MVLGVLQTSERKVCAQCWQEHLFLARRAMLSVLHLEEDSGFLWVSNYYLEAFKPSSYS